ncbi:K02A2.6-like [Cordylochernes scorpioides]|uniref:ATP-dependent DNA helicase n=1 Tax=Cordylochernes scorpioides TaxID=51811 RepID=A0ABY6JZE6_9ARAC|nr:K02A2.6-like [Cordylochernes scorpioides]
MPRRGRGRLTLQTTRRAYMTRRRNNTPNPISPVPTEYFIGGLEIVCPNCSALHFPGETVVRSCCHQGKVSLPALPSFPYEIQELMTSNSVEAKYFQSKIRSYNSSLDFASMGDPGWTIGFSHEENMRTITRSHVTMLQFYSYRLAIRPGFPPIHYSRRIFQQYVVDAYVKTEGNRLNYIRQNQSLLRVELYQGLMDYIQGQEHSRGVRLGRIFILLSSFPGSSRAMHQNYQDAMAIADKCKFTDINENLCDQFVSGCFDEATLKRLLSEPFLTFDSAINIANSVEAAKSQVNLMKNPGHDIDKLKARSKNFKFPCKYNNPCKICGKSNHDTKLCKFKYAQCYICNKKGHIAPVCWNKKSAQNSGMNKPNQNKLNTIQCNTLENAPKIMVNVKIEDADTIMEVDTEGLITRKLAHIKTFKKHILACLKFLYLYKRVFENKDLPIQGIKGSISLRPNAKPKFFKFRPVPFSIKEKIDKELDRLEKSQIIEKVNASDWSTPLVTVIKSNGELRLCGDFKNTLNNCIEDFYFYAYEAFSQFRASGVTEWRLEIEDEKYPLPTIETMLGNLGGNKIFTKLDLSSAYHQIEMDEASKNLLVVSTHRGLYRYNRLPFGISPASAIFQRCMDSLFHDVPNTVIYLDDIFIGSKDEQEHYRILEMIFDKLKELNFTLNKEKCLFLKKDICFLGHIINEDGVRPDSKKLEALERCKKPFDKTSLKSFLGMLSFYSKYIPNMSTLAGPLYQLLKKDNRWKWSSQCEKAFLNLKLTLLNSQALIHYSMKLPLTLTCDASAYGISGVLCHIVEGEEKPITFVSRTLSSAEVKYSQTEKEALAIVFATSKLRQYLFGRKFVLKSDHKDLTTVFGNKRLLPPLFANRLHRWALELSNFDFDIRYTNKDTMLCADAFSRLPLEEINSREDNIDLVTHDISFLNVTPLDHLIIEEETNKDPVLNKLKEYLLEDPQLAKKDETMKPFLSKLENFSVLQGCIFVDSRAVIPRTCQDQMLKLLHQSHIGINRMKSLARSSVWWPKMDSQIEEFVKECSPCMHHQTAPPAENTPWPRTNQPWQRVHVDHFYFRGDCYLLVVDANSNWIEVFPVRGTTSQENIKLLRECFARYGLPQCLVSDNGPPFNSIEFKEFLRKNNVYHLTSPAYNPSSNGIAEVSVRIIKKSLEKSLEESPNSNMDCILQNVLFNYRNTPTSLDKPPVERLLSYVPRTFLNCLNSEFIQKTFGRNECGRRHFQVGDKVLFTRVIQNRRKWFKAQVIRRLGYNIYLVKNLKGTFKVHVNQMRTGSDTKYAEDSDWTLDNAGAGPHRLEQDPQISTSPPPRRSTRPRCPPCREEDKPRDRDFIVKLVCAEILSPTMQVQLYDMVRKHMIHGPCGNFHLRSPCMSDGKCIKDFPKSFLQLTEANNNGYPRYRRRVDGQTLVVGTHQVDNRWVVPYNPYLLVRFNAHIKVEVCASVKSVKYIFKYVYKGHDRTEVEVTVGESALESRTHDEIESFLDARYVSVPEAIWRMFEYRLHAHSHTICRLAVHLPNFQSVYFFGGSEEQALENASRRYTTLTAWFHLNCVDVSARTILYRDIPSAYVFRQKQWHARVRGGALCIGRMYSMNPKDSERYHLRLQLLHVAGAQSLEDLRTVDDIVCSTFKEAAQRRELLADNSEWDAGLAEAALFQMPCQLRQLFATILIFNNPYDPGSLWTKYKGCLSEDLSRGTSDTAAEKMALRALDFQLRVNRLSCHHYGLPAPLNPLLYSVEDHLDVVVLGGDFRQVLPVVPRASRAEIVDACIKRSKLWPLFVILRLAQNRRAGIDAQSFSQWLLKVGDGDLPTDQQGLISLPESCIFQGGDLVQEIFGSLYGDINALSESVILTPKNTDSLEINEKVLDCLPNRSQCFFSIYSVECENVEEQNNYATEFLNSLTPTGMPPHRLNLKIGANVMLLRDLNPKQGLCNGTRMVIQCMCPHVLEAQILTGTKLDTLYWCRKYLWLLQIPTFPSF